MSGLNDPKAGVPKYACVDRNDFLTPLKSKGPIFHDSTPNTITAAAITQQAFVEDMLLTAATPAVLTGPTAVSLCQYFQSAALLNKPDDGMIGTKIGTSFQITIENTDAVAKTINFGAGVTGGPLTVTANSVNYMVIELSSLTPQTYRLLAFYPTIVAGLPATGIQQIVGSQGTVYTGPVYTTSAGDFTASEITNVPAGTIASVDVQAAINELDGDVTALTTVVANKVTLRDLNGAVGTGSATSKNILVSIAPNGDTYVPSELTRPAQAGSFEVGPLALGGNVAQTNGGNLFESRGGTAVVPLNSHYAALGGLTNPTTPNFAMYTSSVSALGYGQTAAVPQHGFRSILPAGLVASFIDTVGAYFFTAHLGVSIVFGVNSAGNVKLTPTAGPQAANIARDANGYIALIASRREVKREIEHVSDTDFIWKVPARRFIYRNDPSNRVRVGAVVEEVLEAGASHSYLCHDSKWDAELKTNVEDDTKPTDLNDRALFWALVDQVQQLKADVERLKARLASRQAKGGAEKQ